jgi:hypothetical protein
MVPDEREAEGRCLVDQRWIQLDVVKAGARLSEGGLQRAEVADGRRTTTRHEHAPVEVEDFRE